MDNNLASERLESEPPDDAIKVSIARLQFVLEATGGHMEDLDEPGQSHSRRLIHKALRDTIRTLEGIPHLADLRLLLP